MGTVYTQLTHKDRVKVVRLVPVRLFVAPSPALGETIAMSHLP